MDDKLINDIRDVIYAEGMTSRERAERIIGLVRSHDAQRGYRSPTDATKSYRGANITAF
jgi:hypothetical protein